MKYIVLAAFFILAAIASAASPTREYQAHVDRVKDGDTYAVTINIGFDLFKTDEVRLNGIDTPEHGTAAGDAATASISKFLTGKDVIITLTLDKRGNPRREKYGRLLAAVSVDGKDLTTYLIEQKLGRPYHGEKKEPWGPADTIPGP